MSFSETLRGTLAFGVDDPSQAVLAPASAQMSLAAELTVGIDDITRFLTMPDHSAELTGWVECDALGGKLPIETGEFNLLVEGENPWSRRMLYRVCFRNDAGQMLTLSGVKLGHKNIPVESVGC